MRTGGAQSVDRALVLLLGIIDDGGRRSIAEIGRQFTLAPATSYRLVESLRRAGLVLAVGKGRYLAGPALAGRRQSMAIEAALAAVARPLLRRLAHAAQCVAHVGVLESDMVTYLVREGANDGAIHSQEGKQLEAYCSGIGKVLLAALPPFQQDSYLRSAPFIALTDRTITDPAALRSELADVAARGFARDIGESSIAIHCLAIALRDPGGTAIAALSVSRAAGGFDELWALAMLREARDRIEAALFAQGQLS